MPTFTCYVAGYNNTDDLSDIGNLTLNENAIGNYIKRFSGTAQLNVAFNWERWGQFADHSIDLDGTNANDLPGELTELLGVAQSSALPSLGLLICNQLFQAPQQYGMMFDEDEDAGSIGPRQGFALFIAAIKAGFQDAPTPAALAEFIAYTAVHELGHAFNLWHVNDTSFMQPNPVPANNRPYVFNNIHSSYLALASQTGTADYVLPGPGRKPYGTLAPGFHAGDDSPYAGPPESETALSLQIKLSHPSFWSFEPVELDVELNHSNMRAVPVSIPNEIDPGYPSFQIWITRPDGGRFSFCPQARFCRPNGERQIAPNQTYRRDIAISRQSGGYTFTMPGHYQVQASLRLQSGRFLMSNLTGCEVLPAEPSSALWTKASALLERTDVRRLLRYKRRLPSYRDCARMTRLADEAPSLMTSAIIHYALGKALIHSAPTMSHDSYADDMRRRGISHLRQVLDLGCLGHHRTEVATSLLEG